MDRLGAQGREIDERLDRIRRSSHKLQSNLVKTGSRGTNAFGKMSQGAQRLYRNQSNLILASTKRLRLIREEKQDLRELIARRRKAFSVSEIKAYNKRIAETRDRISVLKSRTDKYSDSISGLGNQLKSVKRMLVTAAATYLTIRGVNDFIESSKEATTQLEAQGNAIRFAQGTAEGNKTLDFLRKESDRLGLSLSASRLGMANLAGAMRGTNIQAEMQREIFSGVSVAASAMNLSGDDSKAVFRALGQMMSKGVVSTEELRLQIGERLPGAFQIAADAMGVSQRRLNEMLRKGEVMSEDFLPRFAAALKANFSGALSESTKSLRAESNRQENIMLRLRERAGTLLRPVLIRWMRAKNRIAALISAFIDENGSKIIQGVTNIFKWISQAINLLRPYVMRIIEGFRGLWSAIVSLISKVTDLSSGTNTLNGILNVATGIITGVIGVATWLVEVLEANWKWLKYVAMGVGAVIVVTKAWKIAQLALNVALSANPIGIIITLIAGLVAAIVWAWDNMEGFRGAIMGIWAAAKQVFTNLAKLVINFVDSTFRPFLESFNHMKEGNIGQALLSLGEGVFNVSMVPARLMTGIFTGMSKLGEGVGDAFASGFDEGVAQVRESKMQEQLRKAEEAQGKLGQNTNPGQGETNPPGMDTPGELEQGMQAITGGGARATHINISLNDLVGELNLYPANVEQGMDEITDVILDRLLRVLNSANQIATK